MIIKLYCGKCSTQCELDEAASDPSVDVAAFCLLWVRRKACRCAGFSLDAAPQGPSLRLVTP